LHGASVQTGLLTAPR